MQKTKLLILVAAFTFFLVNLASAQVKDTVLKPADTSKIKLSKSLDTAAKKPMTRKDSMKAKYVNPGKVAGRKAVFRSMIIPGWGQLYNMQLLNDGYGTRAGKSQFFQKLYTGGKIAAIYGGITVLTMSYIESSKQYNLALTELQYRDSHNNQPDPNGPFGSRYSTTGITQRKDTYRRNKQIVLFSYGLVYFANIVDAYVAARLHFFNIDDNLSFKVMPSMINTNSMYGFNATPALKLSLTF
ncbi:MULTISPECIES: DUF5683 domain-containing protein [unclassified Pedobacter]|uniref:DUF5683 domain-containing protein n=1 Tax=unclassified Pedobacter TaxID=2628915 RepID=UPI001D7B0803|nr:MULTISPECIES: DUF5683 domain-containing protein [unclassified Pedobacter]CAH0279953.1 hypothetical protein SRABI126_03738 [Pedobacter sp. Bi126]CAH0306930.1 hypothetical protein SRABI36_04854 [Pedobacter sp. Bi36]